MEKKLRAKLEDEIKELRQGNELNIHNITETEENFDQLRLKLNDYEEKVFLSLKVES